MSQTRPTIVFTVKDPWVQSLFQELAPDTFEIVLLDLDDPKEVQTHLPRADFLISGTVLPDWVPLLSRCKLVQKFGVGLDNIDVEGLREAGIPLSLSPTLTPEGVAEHTLLLILALLKQLIPVQDKMRQGIFDQFGHRTNAHILYRKKLGIIGFGRIGRKVAQLAHAFEVTTLYSDIIRAPLELEQELNATRASFNEVIEQADIVTVHAPLTSETSELFTAKEFGRMKKGALFINTSRGATYNLDDLCEALVSGHLGGAGLDVFDPEPPPKDHPILKLPNVICTPHTASGTIERHHAITKEQFDNCQRVLEGRTPLHLYE